MLNTILIVVAALIVLFLIVVALRPSDFSVTRSARIAGPPEAAFAEVNDLHHWEAWSPWARIDPAAKNTYEGPPAGTGATFGWSGNNKVGEGRMIITESRPNELIRFRLEFQRPMQGTNVAEFTFEPEDNQTVVTWTMSGKYNFVGKAFGLIINCEKMMGGQFEKGLAQLNSVVRATVNS
ncbi:MAG TPA: SRPBCC family protein [Verrucomicrobiae bacterium]|jgi:uncharacterized protein YndB with AHSA1/START domain|nr:SRPBCC family protein [Verrucomicrobiae bacterium]